MKVEIGSRQWGVVLEFAPPGTGLGPGDVCDAELRECRIVICSVLSCFVSASCEERSKFCDTDSGSFWESLSHGPVRRLAIRLPGALGAKVGSLSNPIPGPAAATVVWIGSIKILPQEKKKPQRWSGRKSLEAEASSPMLALTRRPSGSCRVFRLSRHARRAGRLRRPRLLRFRLVPETAARGVSARVGRAFRPGSGQ